MKTPTRTAWPSHLLLVGLLALLVGPLAACQWGGTPGRPAAAPASRPGRAATPLSASVAFDWRADGGADGLRWPSGVTIDRQGRPIVLDSGNQRLLYLSQAGRVVTQWPGADAAAGRLIFAPPMASAGDEAATALGGLAVDADGTIYIVEPSRPVVRRLDRAGQVMAEWGTAEAAEDRLVQPAAIAIDARGAVYVADRAAHRIVVFDQAGRLARTWGERGERPGQLNTPVGVAVDAGGRVYVADQGNHRLQVFDGSGAFLTAWGERGDWPGAFARLTGVALDGAGHVFALDTGQRQVQVFDASGAFLTAWDGAGSGGEPFAIPNGIAADAVGAIYITDLRRGHLQKFQPRAPWPTPGVWRPATTQPVVVATTPPAHSTPLEPPPIRLTPTDR